MDQRYKIMQLTGSLAIGGAEKLILSLAEHIDPEKFEVHVCAFGKPKANSYMQEFQNLKQPFHYIPSNSFYSPMTYLSIARYVRDNKIDLIHTHLIFADIIGSVLGKLLKVPVVTTLHNEPNSYRKRRLDRRWLARVSAERITTHLVTVANFIRDQFMIYWKIPDGKVSCIYNGVDLDEFLHIPEQIENDTNEAGLTIVNVASLTAQKAQHILLEAAKLVLSEQPDTRFLIVGKGDLEESLKAKALALGISENVVFTGVRRDIPEILSQSHIFVLSSLWEGLPLSAIEAMAAARGVVVTDVGGIRELIEPNKHGLVVQPGDVKELANALLMLMRNQSLRISYAKSARENVRTLFNIELTTRQYQELYLTVLDSALV